MSRDKETPDMIVDVPEDVAQVVAAKLVSWVEGFPYEFVFYFPLLGLEAFGTERLDLCNRVQLIRVPEADEEFEGVPTVAPEQEAQRYHLVRGRHYLRVKSAGYLWIAQQPESAVAEAFSTARQVLALAIISEMFQRQWTRDSGQDFVVASGPGIHTDIAAPNVSPDVAKALTQFRLSRRLTHRPASLLDPQETYATGVAVEESARAERLQQRFAGARKALDADIATLGVQSFLTAAEWYFDAIAESNETLSLVKTCIGFEALLGDDALQEERGITAALADRFSFLLGKNSAEREKLRDAFRKYYRVRSKLVHGRASRLKGADRTWLMWGKVQLARALRKEVENVT